MIYVSGFGLMSDRAETDYIMGISKTCYTTWYPFKLFDLRGMPHFEFADLTILYGGNGSGKSTILNLLSEKLKIRRETPFNKSSMFDDYVSGCSVEKNGEIPFESSIITSDDVFNHMITVRNANQRIDSRREELFSSWYAERNPQNNIPLRSLDDYDDYKKRTEAKQISQSEYVRRRLNNNVPEYSNGESAVIYITERISESALFLLDEPENSLSAEKQQGLARYIEESVRFYKCQIIMSTHSPFMLSIPGAKIYNLDNSPVTVDKWTELDNVRSYYDFFRSHSDEFEL